MDLKMSKKPKMKVKYLGSSMAFQGKSEVKNIFAVTSVNEKKYDHSLPLRQWRKVPNARCWGWLPNLDEARKAVKADSGGMAECCYYTHAVIEELGPGIPCIDSGKTHWYQWHVDPKDPDHFRGKWMKCAEPEWAKNICAWGL
jgi:hypothetical protein